MYFNHTKHNQQRNDDVILLSLLIIEEILNTIEVVKAPSPALTWKWWAHLNSDIILTDAILQNVRLTWVLYVYIHVLYIEMHYFYKW